MCSSTQLALVSFLTAKWIDEFGARGGSRCRRHVFTVATPIGSLGTSCRHYKVPEALYILRGHLRRYLRSFALFGDLILLLIAEHERVDIGEELLRR